MQSKGFIKLIAVLLALVIFLVRDVDVAGNPDPSNPAAEIFTEPLEQQAVAEQHYLDSIQNLQVFNMGFKSFTYKECKEKELNLGLDLKGGMNVMLEVQVEDVVKALAGDSAQDPAFIAAIEEAMPEVEFEQLIITYNLSAKFLLNLK